MKRELEKSLKRYLKRKIKVTLGLLVTFLITGEIGYSLEYADKLYNNIQDVVEDAEYKVKVGDQGVNYRYGIMVYNNSDLDIQSDNIEIINVSSGNEVEGKEVAAINLRMNSELVLGT